MIAKITGRGEFPIDMLRYDRCHPASSEDCDKIARSFTGFGEWTVTVAKDSRRSWTVARWSSFGVKLEELK